MFQEGDSTLSSNHLIEDDTQELVIRQKKDLIAFLSENNSLFELDLKEYQSESHLHD